ncbi:hypothetical protein AN457_11965 [Pseudomonas aeruginosa]|nr:hypothetical protein AN457_11965 [Pseudomonas aeruginosa]
MRELLEGWESGVSALCPGMGIQSALCCEVGREILDGLPRYRAFVVLRAEVVAGRAAQHL